MWCVEGEKAGAEEGGEGGWRGGSRGRCAERRRRVRERRDLGQGGREQERRKTGE
jgi:hypothetical protein